MKFGTEILESYLTSLAIFSQIILDFFKNYSKNFFSDFCLRNSFILRHLFNECSNIYIYTCYMKKSPLDTGTTVGFVAMRSLTFVCLSKYFMEI